MITRFMGLIVASMGMQFRADRVEGILEPLVGGSIGTLVATQALAEGYDVYCGCAGGLGRTGTFLAVLVAAYRPRVKDPISFGHSKNLPRRKDWTVAANRASVSANRIGLRLYRVLNVGVDRRRLYKIPLPAPNKTEPLTCHFAATTAPRMSTGYL
jgi:hypothetical protein